MTTTNSLTNPLEAYIAAAILKAGGWMGFDQFMHLALYTPALGYYASDSTKFGHMPTSGSDFVTAPEISPLFGLSLAAQIKQALSATNTHEIWEFGAGSGALALQLLQALGDAITRYTIMDVSGSLRQRQQLLLAPFAAKIRWLDHLPEHLQGVVIGNEVLDAMPVKLLARKQAVWHERGVVVAPRSEATAPFFAWDDRPTDLRPPQEITGYHGEVLDYLTEIHPQAEAFIATLSERLQQGAAFFFDYGFGESEYYHPQRHMGTVMCHFRHEADTDPLIKVGLKDITAHVNFTGLALAAQNAGLAVLGYTTQAHFLINCGLVTHMENTSQATRANALKLIAEHEMGELFKVIGFYKGSAWDALGFSHGDRTHRL